MYLIFYSGYMEGIIKVLKNGFGFLTVEGQDDVFFHAKSLEEGVEFEALREGMTLSFEIGEGNNGKSQAINVNLVEGSAE